MADGGNPVVAGPSRHPQPALGRRWPTCRPRPRTIIAALTGAGARILWLLENPRSGGSALGPENEAKRLAYNAWLRGAGRRPRRPVPDRRLSRRPSPPTASPPATPRAPACSATTCTTPRPAPSSRPPPPSPSSRPSRRSRRPRNTPAPPRPGTPRPIPAATGSTPRAGRARSATPATPKPGSSLACAFSTETSGGRHLVGDAARRHRRRRRARAPLPGALRHRLRRRRHRALPGAGAPGRTSRASARSRSSSSTTARASSASTPAAPAPASPRAARTRRSWKARMVLSASPSLLPGEADGRGRRPRPGLGHRPLGGRRALPGGLSRS